MSGLGDMTLLRCVTDGELREAVALRNELFHSRSGLEFDEHAEARRDGTAEVFLLRCGGTAVSTVRLAPYPSVGSSLSEFGATVGGEVDSEVSRLAAVRSATGLRHSLVTMVLGASWVLELTNHRHYASYVNPALVPLYSFLGARDTGARCNVPGRRAPYAIISGRFEDSLRLGAAQLGLTPGQARAHVRWDDDARAALLSA